jgi:hypothetical protein
MVANLLLLVGGGAIPGSGRAEKIKKIRTNVKKRL